MAMGRVVCITGCDSGLGWALAARMAREGLVTIAGMHGGTDTDAAKALKEYNAHTCSLDVTDLTSISSFRDFVKKILHDNPKYKLYALVNNAGVMTVGDFEWHTMAMIDNVINVNLLGAMRVTSAFLPDLRKAAKENSMCPRIINVGSHCGMQPLPYFATYSASKAGLLSWTSALRFELRPYNVSAITFLPGGFIGHSNILADQTNAARTMIQNLDEEQKCVYAEKLDVINNYLRPASNKLNFDSLKDESITETFMKALIDDRPKYLYKVEPWRYTFYYSLLKCPFPETIHNWILQNFISFPAVRR